MSSKSNSSTSQVCDKIAYKGTSFFLKDDSLNVAVFKRRIVIIADTAERCIKRIIWILTASRTAISGNSNQIKALELKIASDINTISGQYQGLELAMSVIHEIEPLRDEVQTANICKLVMSLCNKQRHRLELLWNMRKHLITLVKYWLLLTRSLKTPPGFVLGSQLQEAMLESSVYLIVLRLSLSWMVRDDTGRKDR